MKKRTLIVLMIMALITSLCFTACGKKAQTLEQYCKDNPEVQESIDKAMTDSSVLVEIKGNDIVYTFDLSSMDGYTEELAKSDAIISALEEALGAASGTFGGISKSIEDTTEIKGINTVVNYNWGDEVLVTKTFTSADAAAAGADADDAEDAAEEAEDAAEDAAEGDD